jgi:hypothetical protein
LRETPKVVKIDLRKNNQKIKVENFLKINPLPTQPGDRVEGIE